MQGEVLGSYRIISKLGQGGMGAVYLAEHEKIGRKAAVKVLLPELSQKQEIVTRFFNEARASTAVAHPGIVQAFDFGFHTDNCAYIIMELLSGEALDERLKRLHRLPEEDAVRIARQCASALHAAHTAGIIHRDLKPGNIFLCTDPEMEGGERAKILDFGVAKLTDTEQDSHFKTRTGSMLGTPVYMSPEQCRGAGAVDHRSDIYALGCVLFRMVCGRPPFHAEGLGEIIACHLREPPPSLRSIEPSVSPQLDALVQRTLAKSPDNRFASMAELADVLRALRRAPSGFPGSGYADSTGAGSARPGQPTPWTPVPAVPAAGSAQAPGLPPGSAPGATSWPPTPAGSGDRHDSPPTTLGAAASQRLVQPQGKRRSMILLAAAAGLATVGGFLLVLLLGSGGDDAAGDEQEDSVASAAEQQLPPPGDPSGSGTIPDPAIEMAEPPEAELRAGADEDSAPQPGLDPEATTTQTSAGKPDDEPEAVTPITVTLHSNPDGASVYRPGEKAPLGKTPYEFVAPPQDGEITLHIRKRGYQSATISFAGDRDDTVQMDLKPRPRSKPRRKPSIPIFDKR